MIFNIYIFFDVFASIYYKLRIENYNYYYAEKDAPF